MPKPRYAQISAGETTFVHLVSRVVRRSFLCGKDDLTGNNYDRVWGRRPATVSARPAIAGKHPWLFAKRARPLSIAHRGASHYAYDNSAAAFKSAEILCADFWEIDVRTTSDGVLVAYHDPDLTAITSESTTINQLTYKELLALTTQHQRPVEQLSTVLEMASRSSTGVYLDAKDSTAVKQAPMILKEFAIEQAVIACFSHTELKLLADTGCDYPLAILVPPGKDPFKLAEQTGADIIHLCWEHAAEKPQHLVTADLLDEARSRELPIVLWHEERTDIIQDLVQLPVLGICSNRPELLNPYTAEHSNATNNIPAIACHRGANTVCPENTLLAALCAFGAGYQYVEIDVHATSDGELMVIHDDNLHRTTTGSGAVSRQTLQQIETLDAGSWFNPFFANTRVPLFTDILELTARHGSNLYIEIKTAEVADVLDTVQQFDMLEHCFFWSFKQHYLSAIREQSSAANIMTRRKDYPSLNESIRFVNAQIIEFDFHVDDLGEVVNCQRSGCKAMVAYNGTDIDVFNTILDAAPDIVNLNHPNLLRQCLRAR